MVWYHLKLKVNIKIRERGDKGKILILLLFMGIPKSFGVLIIKDTWKCHKQTYLMTIKQNQVYLPIIWQGSETFVTLGLGIGRCVLYDP